MANEVYPQKKVCTKCGEEKIFNAFGTAKKGLNGLRGMCRACYNTRRKTYYASVRELKITKRREYETRPDVIARRRAIRNRPDNREKERLASRLWKSTPSAMARIKATRRIYESLPENRSRMVFLAAKARADKCGLNFSITEEWVLSRVIYGRCEVTNLPFDLSPSKNRTRNPFCPSIDQIDAGKGYTQGNCRVVLVAVNLALCDWGLDQFLYIAEHALKYSIDRKAAA